MALRGGPGVQVEGLNAFRRELRQLDNMTITTELRDAFHDAAQDVVTHARPRFVALGKMGVKVAATLTAARTASAAVVRLGSAAVPYAGAVEFGADSNILRPRSTGRYLGYNQFLPHLGQEGYALYPTIRERQDDIMRRIGTELDRITRAAFPD